MKKVSVVLGLAIAVIVYVAMASQPGAYGEFTNNAFKHFGYGEGKLPIVMVRTSNIDADAVNVESQARSLGASAQFKVDVDQVKSDFKKRTAFSFDGKKMDSDRNKNYVQTFVMYTNGRKGPACFIRVGEAFYDRLNSNTGTAEDKLVVAHEASHCPQLASFLKRDQYEASLPGVRYLRNGEIVKMYKEGEIGKREAVFLLKYSEYIREVSADYASLLYMRHVEGLDNAAMMSIIKGLKDKRDGEDIVRHPNSVGHYTTPFIEMIEKDVSVLDKYKSEFIKDDFYASMKMAYDLGKDHSFTFSSFYRQYKDLGITTFHI